MKAPLRDRLRLARRRATTKPSHVDERSASILMGQALKIEVMNIVDPNFTVVTKIRKQFLPAR